MKKLILNIITDKENRLWVFPIKVCLLIFSWIYGCVVILRNLLFQWGMLKAHKIERPVISVGNIVMGGTGKTPLVMYIVRNLLDDGKRPAVLTRGFMEKSSNEVKSDEADMIQMKYPNVEVLVGGDRVKSAKQFLNHNDCDVFVMDDGFQRQQVKRDLNILIIDGSNPFGNGALLPRGVLREPKGALKRADIIVLSRSDYSVNLGKLKRNIYNFNERALLVEAIHKPVRVVDPINDMALGLGILNGRKVLCLSSIANPKSFIQTVRSLNAQVVDQSSYIDHYTYKTEDVAHVIKKAIDSKAQAIVTTEKDVVKLKEYFSMFAPKIDLYVLGIEIVLKEGAREFSERLNNLL